MPQQSGPRAGTTFTDEQWRAIIGDEPAIIGDVDGTAYRLVLSTSSNTATLGSTSQDSTSVVAGYMHRIPAGETESLTIPDAVGGSRTDIIAVRYDATYTTDPGPCRLYRIAGATGGGLPTHDSTPPGVEDLPLYAVTRQPGQSLSQAVVQDLRKRRGPTLVGLDATALEGSHPVGTHVRVGGTLWVRRLDSAGAPFWQKPHVDNDLTTNKMGRLTLTDLPLYGAVPNVYMSTGGVLGRTTYRRKEDSGTRLLSFSNRASYTIRQNFAAGAGFTAAPVVTTNIASGDGSAAQWESRAIDIDDDGFTIFVYSSERLTSTWSGIPVCWYAFQP